MSAAVNGAVIALREMDELLPYARNSRTHSASQVAEIAAFITEFGMVGGIVVRNGVIAKGHGTLAAIRKIYSSAGGLLYPAPGKSGGAEPFPAGKVPVLDVSGWSDAQFRAYVIADNKIAENAEWDMEALGLELADLNDAGFNLALTGFDDTEVAELMAQMSGGLGADGAGTTGPDDVPDLPEHPVSVHGDIWAIGDHRVMCGSSLEPADWDKLMAGALADVVWTDPPYNVDIGEKLASVNKALGRKNKTGGIMNDSMGDGAFYSFLLKMYQCVIEQMKPGAPIYVFHADSEGINFRTAFRDAGFKLQSCLTWKKNTFVLSRWDHHPISEPCLYGWKPGAAHKWYGGRKQSTLQELGEGSPFQQQPDGSWAVVWGDEVFIVDGNARVETAASSVISVPKPARSELHPTMKPTILVEKQLRNSSKRGDIVVDAFGGSGSTMIAAHQLGLQARLMELDAKYVDVICRRLWAFTGIRPVHAVTGEPFPDVGEDRSEAFSVVDVPFIDPRPNDVF